jgi:histidyl-tRNA synthetase
MAFKGNMKKRMQKADASGAGLVVFVDAEQWSRRELEIKFLASGEQRIVRDVPDIEMDVFDEIRAQCFVAKVGMDRDTIFVSNGRVGFLGNESAPPE